MSVSDDPQNKVPPTLGPPAQRDVDDFKREIRAQMTALGSMFNDPGLDRLRRRSPAHPAVQRYERLAPMAERVSFDPADELATLLDVSSAMFDRHAWLVDAEGGDYWQIIPEEEARRVLRSRLADPAVFGDVVTELFFWGYLRGKGARVDLSAVTGMPDLRVGRNGTTVWADAKRIRAGTNPLRVRKVIGKASSQVKLADPSGVGAALLFVERHGLRANLDDRTPSDVAPYLLAVEREMGSNGSRSIGQVVVVWDDYMVMDDAGPRRSYYVRRRSSIVRHQHPRAAPLLPDDFWDVGLTVVMSVGHSGQPPAGSLPPIAVGNTVIATSFRELTELHQGVRMGQALEVLADHDGEFREGCGDFDFLAVSRKVGLAPNQAVLLVLGRRFDDGRTIVEAGFRLVPSPSAGDDVDVLAGDPRRVIDGLVARFGVLIRAGGKTGTLLRDVVVFQPTEARLPPIEPVAPQDTDTFIYAVVVPAGQGLNSQIVRWAFALDMAAYRSSLRR